MDAILKEEFLPPIEASIDPIFSCNLNCEWCNSAKPILKNPAKKGKKMPTEHLLNLCRFLGRWGVKGVCFAGGGEPFLHEDCFRANYLLKELGVETAFLTNGVMMTDQDIQSVVECSRWIGFSVDSGDRNNYALLKGVSPEIFDKVIDRMRKVIDLRNRTGSRLEISYKFLIHPRNASFIYKAALLARDIGVDYIHFRPAASENILGDENFVLLFPLDLIEEELEKAFSLETETFKVYGIRHKFSPTLNLERRFSSCLASPLLIQLGADGNVYLCVDHRGKDKFILGSHYPDPSNIERFWGGNAHRELIKRVDVKKCPRCTFGIYNEIMEKVIIEDAMCKNFP